MDGAVQFSPGVGLPRQSMDDWWLMNEEWPIEDTERPYTVWVYCRRPDRGEGRRSRGGWERAVD